MQGTIETATAITCECGDTRYAGVCLNVGVCEDADKAATRSASTVRSKYTVQPNAFTISGRVD